VDRVAKTWPVPVNDLPAREILLLSTLLAGTRVDATGGLVPSTTDEVTIAWNKLRATHPGLFTCPAGDQLSWHEHEAEACEIQKNWVGAAFHLGRLIEDGPPRWEICARRANVSAELGEWDASAGDYARAIRLGADDPKVWTYLAYVMLARGDVGGCREVRSSLTERYRGTDDPSRNNLLAWTWAVGADPEGQPELAVELASRAVASQPRQHAYLGTLGAALFRADRYEEAARRLDEAVEAQAAGGTFSQQLFLSMAHSRMGHDEEARRWLARADRWWATASGPNPPAVPARPAPIRWQDRLLFALLRREASGLLGPPGPEDRPPFSTVDRFPPFE
jgi:Flp pilus assembly protein TadD